MPRDAVSQTVNVERTGRHKWVNCRGYPTHPTLISLDQTLKVDRAIQFSIRKFNPTLKLYDIFFIDELR